MGAERNAKIERGYTRKLFNGQTTAEQVWLETVMAKNHCKCGARAVGSASIFWPAADFERDHPGMAVKYATENGGSIPIVKFRSSGTIRPFVALPVLYACKACWQDLERLTARTPSYAVVEFHRGPGTDRIQQQVIAGAQ